MKLSLILAVVSATFATASPAAISLNRSERSELTGDGIEIRTPCVECPCSGWDGQCQCIRSGCCC